MLCLLCDRIRKDLSNIMRSTGVSKGQDGDHEPLIIILEIITTSLRELKVSLCFYHYLVVIYLKQLLSESGIKSHSWDGRYQNFDVDTISICKASVYQYITIFITEWTFSWNLYKRIKYTAFCFKFFLCLVIWTLLSF